MVMTNEELLHYFGVASVFCFLSPILCLFAASPSFFFVLGILFHPVLSDMLILNAVDTFFG